MASGEKLWFELGVRDNVSKELTKILGTANELARTLSIIGKEPLIPGAKNSFDNISKLDKAVSKIEGTLTRLRSAKDSIVDPKALSEINKMQLALGKMRSKIQKFREEMGKKPDAMGIKGLAEGFLSSLGFDAALTQATNRTNSYTQSLQRSTKATREQAQANQSLVAAYDKVVNANKNVNSLSHQFGIQLASTFSIYGIQNFLKNLITIGGEFEVQHIALQNILGDVQQANTLFAQLKSLAVESPFSFRQEVTYSKQLSAFNIPYKEIFETTKRLGDMSAGLGVDMSRLILAYGQVRSAAVLRGQELRQFTEAGIPMVQALADEFTKLNGKVVTTGEVFSLIQKRAVPFEMVKKVLWDMTNEGGRFYNMQFNLADTLAGKWSNLRDAWEIMLSDFAKGGSNAGKTLKGIVSFLTEIIKGLNTMSPLLVGIVGGLGATKITKLLNNISSLGYSTLKKNAIEAQRLNAIEINRKITLGEITAKRGRELLLQNQSLKNSMNQLAISGRMSSMQMLRAYKEGEIQKKYIEQAFTLGIINEKEKEAILNGNARLMMQQRISKAMNIGWTGWVGVATMAGMAIWQAYSSWSDNIEQQVNSVVESAKNRAKEIGNVIKQNEAVGVPEDKEDLRGRVKQMQEILENSDAYTVTIQNQVARAKDLTEQYKILLDALKDVKAQEDFTAANGQNVANAIKASSVGVGSMATGPSAGPTFNMQRAVGALFDFFFDDDINKNTKQYEERVVSFENQKRAIATYKDDYIKALSEMKAESEDFAKIVKGLSPEDAIAKIVDSQYWDEFNKRVGDSSGTFEKMAKKLNSYSDGVTEHLNEIISNDIPKIVAELARQEGISVEQYKENAKKAPDITKKTITAIVSSLNEGSTKTRAKLAQVLLEFFGLASSAADTKAIVANARNKQYKDQTTQGRHVLNTLITGAKARGWGDANGNGVWDVKWINEYFKDGTGYVEGLQAMQQAYTSLKEEARAAKAAGGKLSDRQQKEWDRLSKAAEIFDFKDKKSKIFKDGKTSQSDQEAKILRERVRVLSDAEKSYQYWRKLVGDKNAEAHVNEEFGKLLGEQGFKFDDVEQFSQTLKKLREEYKKLFEGKPKSKDMLQALKELDKILAELGRKDFEKGMKDLTSAMDRALANIAQQWSTFKAVRDATGNRALASQMAGLTGARAGFTNQADDMKALLSNDISGIDFAKVFSIGNDGEALKKYVISLGVAENQIEGVVKALTKWQELQRQVINADIQSFAALMGGLKDYDSEIQKINDRLEQQKQSNQRLVGTTDGNGQVITQEQADKANNIAEVKANDEKWQKSVTYINLMNNALALTKRQVSEGITQAQDILNQKLDAGVISAKEYADEMQRIREITDNINKNSLFGANNSFTSYVRGGSGGLRTYLNTQIREAQMMRDNTKATPQQRIEASYRLNAANSKLQGLDKFDKTVGSTAVAVGALGDALQPVIKLFDELGMKEVGQVLGGIQSATNAAASTGTAAIAAFGESAGPYGAAIGAGLSILGSVGSALFSDSSHEDAVALRATLQNQTEVLSDQMQEIIKQMGESYGTEALKKYEELRNNYEGQTRAYQQRIRSIMEDNYGSGHSEGYHFNRWFSWLGPWLRDRFGINSQDSDGFWWIQSALEALSPEQWKELKFENPEAYSQITSAGWNEGELKQTTEGMIKLAEDMKEAQKQLAEQMAGTSFDTIFDDFLNGLYEIGNGAEDVFDDIEKGWKKMINKMIINNLVAQDLKNKLQDWYDNVLSPWNANGRKEDAEDIFGKLQEIEDWAITTTDRLRHRNGLFDVADDDVSRKGVITGSFNENETGLLLSYVNSIRADVSLNRQTLYQILQYVQGQAEMPVLASAQLEQLQTLVALARDRNNFVSEIRDILHSSQTGVKPLRVG